MLNTSLPAHYKLPRVARAHVTGVKRARVHTTRARLRRRLERGGECSIYEARMECVYVERSFFNILIGAREVACVI